MNMELRIHTYKLETAFWKSSDALKRYCDSIDKMSMLTIPIIGFVYLSLLFARVFYAPKGWEWLFVTVPFLYVLIAVAQQWLKHSLPGVHWNNRTIITYCHVALVSSIIALHRVDERALLGFAERHAASRPSWVVVLHLLAAAGPVNMIGLQCHLLVNVRSTAVMHIGVLGAHIMSFNRVMVQVLKHDLLVPGVTSICSAVHTFNGKFLLLPDHIIEAYSELCVKRSWWLVVLFQLTAYSLAICLSYITERSLKRVFLRDHQLHVTEWDIWDLLEVVLLPIITPYIVATALLSIAEYQEKGAAAFVSFFT